MGSKPHSNRISFAVPDGDMQEILGAIQLLREKLQPHLVDLDADQRKGLAKMGAKSVDFVSKALNYARIEPQFKPAFLDVDEFVRDLSAVGMLRSLQQPLSQLADMVDDSLLLSGSEAYGAARAYYMSVKAAASLGHPGASVVADDLGAQFAGRGMHPEEAMPVAATGSPLPPAMS